MKIIIRIFKHAKEWRAQLIVATISLFFVTALNLATPALTRQLLNVIGDAGAANATRDIIIIACAMLGAFLLRFLFEYLNNYYAHIAAWYSVAKMRGHLYNHMQTLSMRYYSDKQTGQLMSRVIEDTANFEVLIAHALPDLITSVLIFIGVLVIIFFINPILALLTCIPVPFIFLTTVMLKKIRKYFTERQKISSELNGLLQDNFSGMKEIQIFSREKYEYEVVYAKARAHASKTLKGIIWVSRLHPAMSLLTGIGTVIVVLFGGLFALRGDMDVADITAFLLYLALLYAPVATLSRVLEDIQTALVSGKRVFEVLDTESDVKDSENAIVMPPSKGDIEFKNVSFDYDKGAAVLKKISFRAKPGQMIALVGPTGAGKTTVTSLLARFYDSSSGDILLDGINIKDCTLESLRAQMSVVLQDVFLFNGTIAENIAYSRQEGVTSEEIIAAAKAANIHDFIDCLPDKYETMTGERGVRLSGGQKQRIAIARAILRKSPILILDEATSAVDNETETQIQTAINSLMGTSTIIVIAHRLSTVEKADEILLLNEGEIVERGTHADLLALGAQYSRMYNKK